MTRLPLVLLLLMVSFPAVAEGREPLGIMLSAGSTLTMQDTSRDDFDYPFAMLNVGVDLNPVGGFLFGVAADLGLESKAPARRVIARGRYRYRIPLGYVFGGLGAGYAWREQSGRDWVASDEGPTFQLDVGMYVTPLDWLGISLTTSYALLDTDAHDRNSSFEAYTHQLLVGIDAVVSF